MEDRDFWKLNWTILFFVTAFSLAVFSTAIKLVDGKFPSLLVLLSIFAFSLGVLSWFLRQFQKTSRTKLKEKEFAPDTNLFV